MGYNSRMRRRKNIRLRGYDYAQPGAYFVTIGTTNRVRFFGEIINGEMQLNDAGLMVMHWFREIERKFPGVVCDTYVCMPDHIHVLIMIRDSDPHTTLGRIVGWFKSMTTNAYIRGVREHGWRPFERRLWHHRYYDCIIRSLAGIYRVRRYIINNPRKYRAPHDAPHIAPFHNGATYSPTARTGAPT